MNRRRNVLSTVNFVLVALMLVGFAQAAPARAQDGAGQVFVPFISNQAQGPDQTVSLTAAEVDASAAAAYWTPEMRAAAKPYSPAGASTLGPREAAANVEAAAGVPGASAGGTAVAGSQAAAKAEFPEEWAAMSAAEAAELTDEGMDASATDGTAGVYTTYRGNYFSAFYLSFPYRAIGKLYFTTWSGGNAYCSASVVSPNNILVTAAHCIYDTDANKWQSNWLFIPTERNGVRPYGSFAWTNARVLNNWINAANYNAGIRYDVALVRLGNNAAARPVTYYTGWLGRSWDWGYVQNHTEVGYPSNLTTLYTSISHSESYAYATDIIGYGSNMGAGASGSPIIRKFQPYISGAVNYVNAVQSGSDNVNAPTYNVAPRFSSNNIVVLCNAEGC